MENPKLIVPAYKVGDTVKLNSGGPVMTVKLLKNGVYEDEKGKMKEGFIGLIACTWFDAITTELKVDLFRQEMLMYWSIADNDDKVIPIVVNKHI